MKKYSLEFYNGKAQKAREQYKMPMYFYYLTKLQTVKETTGKDSPELIRWRKFCREK